MKYEGRTLSYVDSVIKTDSISIEATGRKLVRRVCRTCGIGAPTEEGEFGELVGAEGLTLGRQRK